MLNLGHWDTANTIITVHEAGNNWFNYSGEVTEYWVTMELRILLGRLLGTRTLNPSPSDLEMAMVVTWSKDALRCRLMG